MGIPYAGIGIGISILFGVWAFIAAETVRERLVIGGVPVVVVLAGSLFRSPAGRVIAFVGWIVYGLGCVIFLRYNGLEIR